MDAHAQLVETSKLLLWRNAITILKNLWKRRGPAYPFCSSKAKIGQNSKISFCKNLETQIVLLNRFHLNGHTAGFCLKVKTTFQHSSIHYLSEISGSGGTANVNLYHVTKFSIHLFIITAKVSFLFFQLLSVFFLKNRSYLQS